MGIFDPISQPDPDRDERLLANGTHVEIRPAERVAHLATRALACPSCGVPDFYELGTAMVRITAT